MQNKSYMNNCGFDWNKLKRWRDVSLVLCQTKMCLYCMSWEYDLSANHKTLGAHDAQRFFSCCDFKHCTLLYSHFYFYQLQVTPSFLENNKTYVIIIIYIHLIFVSIKVKMCFMQVVTVTLQVLEAIKTPELWFMKSMSSHVLHTSPTHCAHRGVKVCDVWIQYLIFFFLPSTSPLITRAGKVQVSSFFLQACSSLYSHTISLFPCLTLFLSTYFLFCLPVL